MYKWFVLTLILFLSLVQYRLWKGEGSFFYGASLKQQIAKQKEENETLGERNRVLEAEVNNLKQGLDAVEEQARSELGMIKQGETFYQVIQRKRTDADR